MTSFLPYGNIAKDPDGEFKMCKNCHRTNQEILEIKIRAAKSILSNPLPTDQTKVFVRRQLALHEERLEHILSSKESAPTE